MTSRRWANPFEASWLRIERAEAHRKAAARHWNAFLEGKPYDCSVPHYGNGQFSILIFQEQPAPPEMAVRIGEWLYNLRCALDYAVYAAAICRTRRDPPPKDGQLQCPVYFTESEYRNNEYRLKPLADEDRVILESMQPYRHADPDTSAMGWLHKLARIDRHRRLHVMTSYMAEVNPVVYAPDGCEVAFERLERVIVDGQAEVARFNVTPWQDDWEVQANPQAGIDPEIAEWAASDFWRRIDYNQRLRMLRVAVLSIVVPLEYACTGASRKAEILTDAFRAECDARRKPGK